MILAYLDDDIGEGFFASPLGIEDSRLNLKAGFFQIPPGLLIDRLVLCRNLLPVEVLPQARGAGDDNTIATAKETAINGDYDGAAGLAVCF